MKNYILFVLVTIFLVSCSENDENLSIRELIFKEDADSLTVALKNYNYFDANSRQALFNEEFNNNNNNWPIYNINTYPEKIATISNGEYVTYSAEDPLIVSKTLDIDQTKNFEISVRIKNQTNFNTPIKEYTFFFESNATSTLFNGIGLNINEDFQFLRFKYGNAINNTITSNVFDNANTSDNQYHTITFRKVNDKVSVFFDENFLEIKPLASFNFIGNKIGFYINRRITVDFVKIDYLTF